LLYAVCCHLDARGDWVRDGSNCRADFTKYRRRPASDHSIALVWCQDGDSDARKVVQHVRTAESTTKNAVMAVGAPVGVRHVNVRRRKTEPDRLGEEKELSDSE
jgi:tRNA splicing endonuclease